MLGESVSLRIRQLLKVAFALMVEVAEVILEAGSPVKLVLRKVIFLGVRVRQQPVACWCLLMGRWCLLVPTEDW